MVIKFNDKRKTCFILMALSAVSGSIVDKKKERWREKASSSTKYQYACKYDSVRC